MELPRSEDFRSTYFEEDAGIVAPYTTVVIKPSPSSLRLASPRVGVPGFGFELVDAEHPILSKVRGAHAESRRKMSVKIDPKVLESPGKKKHASFLSGSAGPVRQKLFRPPQTRANLICPPQKLPPTDDCLEFGSGEVAIGPPQPATKLTEFLVRKYTNDKTLKVYDIEVIKERPSLQDEYNKSSPDRKRGLLSDTSIASSVDEEQMVDYQRKASSKLRLGPKTPLPPPQNKYTKHVPPPSLERLEPTYGRKYW